MEMTNGAARGIFTKNLFMEMGVPMTVKVCGDSAAAIGMETPTAKEPNTTEPKNDSDYADTVLQPELQTPRHLVGRASWSRWTLRISEVWRTRYIFASMRACC